MTQEPREEADARTPEPNVVTVKVHEGGDVEPRTAEAVPGPYISNAIALANFARGTIGTDFQNMPTLAMAENAMRNWDTQHSTRDTNRM